MEGAINFMRGRGSLLLVLIFFSVVSFPALTYLQEKPSGQQVDEPAQLRLRKTVKTRDYQGRSVEGEERVISPGDTLWRILIVEKGLAEKRFSRYLVLIGSLNPHLEKSNILRIGDIIFIPIRPDELLGIEVPSARGETKVYSETKVYRVKRGEHLYKILREQLGIQEEQLLSAFSKVKELNPGKKNWDVLLVGEAIRFPEQVKGRSPT
ncbi:MAG: LysM peptidoglycan-binding domain-containing protein, partial [Candidatus Binatia bacterium]